MGKLAVMHAVTLATPDDFDDWRDAARTLAMAGVAAGGADWRIFFLTSARRCRQRAARRSTCPRASSASPSR